MKKIISTILASTCMFCSAAFANSEESINEEKIPKIQIEDLELERSRFAPSNIYNCHKAFLMGLACLADIDVKIKFIPDRLEKNYNFKLLSINDSYFEYSNFPSKHQIPYLIFAFDTMGISKTHQITITEEEYKVSCVKFKKHVMNQDFIEEVGNTILKKIYKMKVLAAKENKLNEIVELTKDQSFKDEIKYLFHEVLKPIYGHYSKVHDFYLPSISLK